ncbi:uncharacterized protein LOC100901002 [Galendromus occidentalis]|uniref:Uncharacterized protein LOC100901002 n=1 Tax=Galendromus occidentalis TaxID=34638 RepID=A0AAJ6QJU5_9ACAR|nr:uncharacterized protein LOC100901002 [Galendromus occidentalis]
MSVFYEIDAASCSRVRKYPWWCDLNGPFELSDGSCGVGPFTLIRYTSNETPGTFNLRCLHSMRKKAYDQLPQKCDVFAVIRRDGTLVRRRYLHNHPPMPAPPSHLHLEAIDSPIQPSFDEVVALLSRDGRGRRKNPVLEVKKVEINYVNPDFEGTEFSAQFCADDLDRDLDSSTPEASEEEDSQIILSETDRACSCPFEKCGKVFANPRLTAIHYRRAHSTGFRAEPLFRIRTNLIRRGPLCRGLHCPQCLQQQASLDIFREHLRTSHRLLLCE